MICLMFDWFENIGMLELPVHNKNKEQMEIYTNFLFSFFRKKTASSKPMVKGTETAVGIGRL